MAFKLVAHPWYGAYACVGMPLAVTNNTDPVCIGVDYLSSPRYFDGIIDEVRIWNVARTQIQIQGSMMQTLSGDESGLAGYWRLDTGTGTNALDSTANDNNGALMNGAPWSTANVAPLQKMRCVHLVDGALLSGFTLTKGGTLATGEFNKDRGGGGVLCNGGGAVSNCVITGCSADVFGGGADLHHGGDLSHCIIRSNHSRVDGGGAVVEEGRIVNSLFIGNSADSDGGGCTIWDKGLLENCTLSGNEAVGTGGGVHVEHTGTNRNTIIYGNTAATGNEAYQGTLESCFTNNPLFVGGDDYHLQTSSPCIDAGTNQTDVADDLDGTPRPLDGDADGTNTIDMGCYEYLNRAADSDGDTMTDGFEVDYGLDPTTDDADGNPDGDPFNNGEEFIADTDPTNAASYFHIVATSNLPPFTVYFDSSSNRLYTLYGNTNLVEGSWSEVTNRMGAGGLDSMSGTNNVPVEFYKLEVSTPE